MAEMTAAEAFNVLNNKSCRIVFKAKNGVSYELREGLSEDIAALIEQQAAEIAKLNDKADAMRCCANCISHHVIINESKCFEGLPIDEWRFSKRAKPVDCDYVCDKWKWLEKEAEGKAK